MKTELKTEEQHLRESFGESEIAKPDSLEILTDMGYSRYPNSSQRPDIYRAMKSHTYERLNHLRRQLVYLYENCYDGMHMQGQESAFKEAISLIDQLKAGNETKNT